MCRLSEWSQKLNVPRQCLFNQHLKMLFYIVFEASQYSTHKSVIFYRTVEKNDLNEDAKLL